MHFIS